jgi:parallel beta-helix repeat protein
MSDFAHRKIMNNDISSPSIGIFLQGAEYNQVLNNHIRIVLKDVLFCMMYY